MLEGGLGLEIYENKTCKYSSVTGLACPRILLANLFSFMTVRIRWSGSAPFSSFVDLETVEACFEDGGQHNHCMVDTCANSCSAFYTHLYGLPLWSNVYFSTQTMC